MRFFAPILEALPPHPKLRQAAGILLLLAPLALIFGLMLRWTRPASSPLAIQHDRDGWVELARSTAKRFGLDATSWNAAVHLDQTEKTVRQYAGRHEVAELRERFHPAVTIPVELHEPGGSRKFEARFAPGGDLLSWSMDPPHGEATRDTAPDISQNLAKAAAASWLKPYGPATFTDWRTRAGDEETSPGWEAHVQFAAAPKQQFRINLGLYGNLPTTGAIHDENDRDSDTVAGAFEGFLAFCGFSLTGFFLIYSLRLFRRRRREGEIPRERVWVLIGIFGICGGLFVGLNPESFGNNSSTAASIATAILAAMGTSMVYALGGLFVSAAYASGEGEIREGWPGKLISFDALLAGKWTTQPVGVSAVLAAAIAAWVFFIAALAWRLDPPQASILIDKDLLEVAVGRNLLIRNLVDLPLRVSFLIVAGLFMPLAFVHRKRWTGRKLWAVLLLSPFFVDAAFRAFGLSGFGPLLTSLGVIVTLVVPFYLLDVLAAVLGALLYATLVSATAIATAAPAVAPTEAVLLILITVVLAPMVAAAWRGAKVDERAVRPTYARNLAERLSLQAEVSAAREAQLRLLPSAMPQQPGLSVAAYCQPAGVVGGDFYDFIQAPNGQLGVFVASGSAMGLASALTIALAKGFLASEVRRGEDPGASLHALLEALSGRVGAAADETGLLVAVVDPVRGDVRLARRGRYPAVWLMRGRDVTPVQLNGTSEGGVETESLPWQNGDALVLSTEGFATMLDDQSLAGQRSWLNGTARLTEGAEASRIEFDLMRRLGGRKGKRLRKLRRDLTTVVLRKQAV